MARWVRIAVVGAAPLGGDLGTDEMAVERMVTHWQTRVGRVLPDRPDVILVPECCDRYAHMSDARVAEYYRARGDRLLHFFADVARQGRCYVAYAAVRSAGGQWYNSIQVLDRSGAVVGIYDKNHPTIGEIEGLGIRPGCTAPLIRCDFGRLACAICFDLNFDELRAQYVRDRPDLILFSSMYHGGLMQPYWAYSCRTYLASAIAGLPSHVIDPLGRVIASTTNYLDFVTAAVNLDYCLVHLDYHWEKLEALKRAYGPGVSIVDPGFLGPVLVSSELEDRTAEDMLREFEMEPLDDYLNRARAAQRAHIGSLECAHD